MAEPTPTPTPTPTPMPAPEPQPSLTQEDIEKAVSEAKTKWEKEVEEKLKKASIHDLGCAISSMPWRRSEK